MHPATVFERTDAGRAALLLSNLEQLDALELQLLAVVNGFTPLGDIQRRFIDLDSVKHALNKLLDRELVTVTVEVAIPRETVWVHQSS